ncbi:hypothetical protein [Methylobacterium sp. WSM2598]|uniref:hypothetical protein n=1 Tax=Methylobacterium sp. WSM2598 TaxID=398261 RepID=UPI00039A115D|nr:hypothetical protein [Methylobacterium sp. WSM2598]
MRASLVLVLATAASILANAPGAQASSCSEQIATIERRLDSAGAERVTGREPPGGPTSSNSPKALDKPPEAKPSDRTLQPSASGVQEARELIRKARAQQQAGDEKGCNDTMTRAKEKAGALP